MGDISDLEQQLNVLKFQLSVMGNGSGGQNGNAIRQQIADLQRQLMLEKMRQGSPS